MVVHMLCWFDLNVLSPTLHQVFLDSRFMQMVMVVVVVVYASVSSSQQIKAINKRVG